MEHGSVAVSDSLPISSMGIPSTPAMTSRNLPVRRAHLSFMTKLLTFPVSFTSITLLSLAADIDDGTRSGTSQCTRRHGR